MRCYIVLIFTLISLSASAQSRNSYSELKDLIYYPDFIVTQDSYIAELAVLDLYYPTDVDNYAPLDHIRKDAPPMLLITGDRELEMLGRYEENAYMMRMMKVVGHKDIRLMELDGYDHGGMAKPAFPLLLNEMKRILKLKR